mmetsp:Transcript_28457/g.39191  ORF Transcript_28457/g.39191 Transcript_28457/m.39191 type:complete len:248 (-) Transcript_28457:587-1330(-)
MNLSSSYSCSALSSLESSCTKWNKRKGSFENDRNELVSEEIIVPMSGLCENWTLSEALDKKLVLPCTIQSRRENKIKLPMKSFNHIAREVLSLEKSKYFYVEILGFDVVPRPPFDCEGYWLYGYGLSLHLVATSVPKERKLVKKRRIQHFSSALPRVDHIAFISNELQTIREILDREKVFYKLDQPAKTGISQLFFFDPDGNVIEVSNCAPLVGEVACADNSSNASVDTASEESFSEDNQSNTTDSD